MYIFVLISTLITYFLGKYSKRFEPFYFLTIILTLVCGLRGEFVGVDTQSYHNIFNNLLIESPVRIIEYGYLLFLKLVIALQGTQQLVFLVFAGFTIYCFSRFIIRYSKDPYLSLTIFVLVGPLYLSTFNQIRQYLAIGIFLTYLIPLIKEKKFNNFLAITLATTFFVHFSALVLIPFYFILNKKISLFNKVSFIILFNIFTSYIISLILMTPYGYFILKREDIEVGKLLFFSQIIISFLILCVENKITQKKINRNVFFNMAYFSIFMLVPLFINNNIPVEIFTRMNSYFFPFIIILIPDLLDRFTKTSNKILTPLFLIFLSLYFFRNTILIGESYNLFPYDFNTRLFSF